MSKERQPSLSTRSSPILYEHTWLVLCGGWYWLVNSFWYCRSSLRPDVAAAFEHVSGCVRRCVPTVAGKANLRLGMRYERGGQGVIQAGLCKNALGLTTLAYAPRALPGWVGGLDG